MAEGLGVSAAKLAARKKEFDEFNPMLGFRGCRLAIAFPEIAEMQARAIFEAAVAAQKTTGKPVVPEVMVPLITGKKAAADLQQEAVLQLIREARIK